MQILKGTVYSHLVILLIAKTALTYARPLQLVTACLPVSQVAHWINPHNDAAYSRVRLPLALKFFITVFIQFKFYFEHHFHIFMLSYIILGIRTMRDDHLFVLT